MKRIVINVIAILLMAVFCGFLIIGNVFWVSVPVAVSPGSYAEDYANLHHLRQTTVPDTLKEGLNLHYETFSFNISGNSVVLEKYKGIGSEIVIPQQINGYAVNTIGERFFSDSPELRTVYISDAVTEIKAESSPEVTLVVSADSPWKDRLEEDSWKVETFNDTEQPIFSLGDIPYEYNETDTEVELSAYMGDENILLLPAYINGKPVTTVSFDMLGYKLVAFPDTVKTINGTTYQNIYSLVFAIELTFTILAFLVVLIVMNVKLSKLSDNKEFLLTGPQIILTFLFFAAQITFALLAIYKSIVTWPVAFIVSAGLLAIYLVLILMAGRGRKQAIIVEENIEKKTDRMNGIKVTAATLTQGITDKDVKKQVERVAEEIRFSDPSSNEALDEIEEKLESSIQSLKAAIKEGDKETILQESETVLEVAQERNVMCKALK